MCYLTALVVVFRDITQRKQQEEQLAGTVRFTAPTGLMQSKLLSLVGIINTGKLTKKSAIGV